jgi:hypothetical protein
VKFFKWNIETKIKRLDGPDRIVFLANKLIKEINAQGRSIMNPSISTGFGNLNIYIHWYGTDNPILQICKISENGGDKFEFQGKPVKGIK